MTNTGFHNFFLSEQGTHLSIGTAVAMGYIRPCADDGMIIVRGKKMSARTAIDAGIIDQMAADYLAALPVANDEEPPALPRARNPVEFKRSAA